MDGSREGGKMRIYTQGRVFFKRGRKNDCIYWIYISSWLPWMHAEINLTSLLFLTYNTFTSFRSLCELFTSYSRNPGFSLWDAVIPLVVSETRSYEWTLQLLQFLLSVIIKNICSGRKQFMRKQGCFPRVSLGIWVSDVVGVIVKEQKVHQGHTAHGTVFVRGSLRHSLNKISSTLARKISIFRPEHY